METFVNKKQVTDKLAAYMVYTFNKKGKPGKVI
jgi:hypothetical protein